MSRKSAGFLGDREDEAPDPDGLALRRPRSLRYRAHGVRAGERTAVEWVFRIPDRTWALSRDVPWRTGSQTLEVMMGRGPRPPGGDVYDARQIRQVIGARV